LQKLTPTAYVRIVLLCIMLFAMICPAVCLSVCGPAARTMIGV